MSIESPELKVTDVQIPAFKAIDNRLAIAIILALSAVVFGFLFWLVYFKPTMAFTSRVVNWLPYANAGFNSLSTFFLLAGFNEIRQRNFTRHMKFMFSALGSSSLFFICYVIYHNFHGDTKFIATGTIRPIYFFILISHIVLSAVAVPVILTSFYLSLAGRYALHRRVSRFTFPIWLYVSVTGVVVFGMLKLFNGS